MASVANYPLQIILPRPAVSAVDAGGPVISRNHRIYWAYPDLNYNIRAAIIGGIYPYTFALQDAPKGMTVQAATGEIDWASPTVSATNITLRVTDSAGTTVTTTWTVTVDPARFLFLDAAAPPGGTGSIASPYRSISSIPAVVHTGKMAYFKSGTYNVLDMPMTAVGGGWDRVEFNAPNKPVVWLAFPGASALIDFGWRGSGIVPLIRMVNGPVYLDGLETAYSHNMAFQLGSAQYSVIRRMRMHHHGPGQDGANSAFLMFLANYGFPSVGTVIQDNVFSDVIQGTGNCALKMYSLSKSLVEDNVFHSSEVGTEALVAIKSDNPRFTVRGNTFYDILAPAIGGNMHRIQDATYGEILYNNVRASAGEALFVNQDGQAAQVDVYRNTFAGRVRMRNTDSADGPFHFYDNVIVSADTPGRWIAGSRIYCENVQNLSRIVLSNNLEGSPAQQLIDVLGRLASSHAARVGTNGWQTLGRGASTWPLRLQAGMLPNSTTIDLRMADPPPARYLVQTSTNLAQWRTVATNHASGLGFTWSDAAPVSAGRMYYRVLWP